MNTIDKASRTAPARNAKPVLPDAIALLKADHAAVALLFAEYEKSRAARRKKALVAEICTALEVHVQIEEEIFYPAVAAAVKDRLLVPEAIVEHDGVRALIAQVRGREPDGAPYDARVKVMSEYIRHHVREEHEEMFPKARASSLDLAELGVRMAARKAQLLADMVKAEEAPAGDDLPACC